MSSVLINKSLTVAHNIFLTQQQRKAVATETVEVQGISIPVWINDGKSSEIPEEVFTNYKVRLIMDDDEAAGVNYMGNGYDILLTKDMAKSILDVQDGGSECLIFAHHSIIKIGDREFDCVNYVSIQDQEILLNSL